MRRNVKTTHHTQTNTTYSLTDSPIHIHFPLCLTHQYIRSIVKLWAPHTWTYITNYQTFLISGLCWEGIVDKWSLFKQQYTSPHQVFRNGFLDEKNLFHHSLDVLVAIHRSFIESIFKCRFSKSTFFSSRMLRMVSLMRRSTFSIASLTCSLQSIEASLKVSSNVYRNKTRSIFYSAQKHGYDF